MARFTALALLFIAAVAQAAPVRLTRRQCVDTTVDVDVADFANLTYNDIQISSGVAGNAAEEANAIFVTPFDGVNRADIPDETQDAIETLRQAAESAETDLFNPAIDEATGDEKKALQVGKIKNKVLGERLAPDHIGHSTRTCVPPVEVTNWLYKVFGQYIPLLHAGWGMF